MITRHATTVHNVSLWISALACCVAAGCASAPPDRFYTLGNLPATAGQDAPVGVNVTITSLTIPELVDRPQLVLRTGANRVAVLDHQRWAERLQTGIGRVIATDLAALLGITGVGLPGQRSSNQPGVLVAVDIVRFDSALNGMVQIEARWSIRSAVGSAPAIGTANVQEISGASVEEVISAHDRALGRISGELARVVRQVVAARH